MLIILLTTMDHSDDLYEPGDYGAFVTYPATIPHLEEALQLTGKLSRAGGGEPNAGRHLVTWALKAGFQRSAITVAAAVDVMAYVTRPL